MKTVHQHTEAELLALTPEAKQQLIELQCALDGVPLLPTHPQCPEAPHIEYDTESFRVVMSYSTVAAYKTRDAAQSVADAINTHNQVYLDYEYFGGRRVDCLKDNTPASATVEHVKCASLGLMAERKAELTQYKKDKSTYDTLKEAYDKASTARADSIATVEDAIAEAHANDFKRKDALAKYNHYVVIADNNTEMAMIFFCANYADLREFLPEEYVADLPKRTLDEITKEREPYSNALGCAETTDPDEIKVDGTE